MATSTSAFFVEPEQSISQPMDLETIYESPSGHAVVFRGVRDGKMRIYKALKEGRRGDPIWEALLRKEFETGYSLSHPAICQTIAFLNLPQTGNCIEMEWIDGIPLNEYLKSRPSEKARLQIALQLCDALEYLHSRQIIHRDIKPSNILVTHNGHNAKLIDFSLSDYDSAASFKQPAGSRLYAAPEMLNPDKEVPQDFRSDIYSLGVVMRDLGLSARVSAKCCAIKPAKRYAGAGEVRKALSNKKATITVFLIVGMLMAALALLYAIFGGENTSERIFEEASGIIRSRGL